jgi:5-hydroxyisourate hydrolase-like protein (transthyretin family)
MQVRFSPFPAWRRLAIMLPALGCLSCSGGVALNPVHGQVLYKNQPIEGVVVTFHPKRTDMHTLLPVGQTQEDGTFTMTTGKNAGALAGEYIVTFTCPQEAEEKGQKGKPKKMVMQRFNLEDRFKGAYGNEAKSTFKVEIKKGKNQLEPFSLK